MYITLDEQIVDGSPKLRLRLKKKYVPYSSRIWCGNSRRMADVSYTA